MSAHSSPPYNVHEACSQSQALQERRLNANPSTWSVEHTQSNLGAARYRRARPPHPRPSLAMMCRPRARKPGADGPVADSWPPACTTVCLRLPHTHTHPSLPSTSRGTRTGFGSA